MIVESFLIGAGSLFGLPEFWRVLALGVGVFLFIGVAGAVVWLVVKYPQNLVFGEESHVEYARMQMYGTEAGRLTEHALNALPREASRSLPAGQIPEEIS